MFKIYDVTKTLLDKRNETQTLKLVCFLTLLQRLLKESSFVLLNVLTWIFSLTTNYILRKIKAFVFKIYDVTKIQLDKYIATKTVEILTAVLLRKIIMSMYIYGKVNIF